MLLLNDATALVTGGGSGLGLATARRLHDAGAGVVVLDLEESEGANLVADLGAHRAVFSAGDVTSGTDVAAALDAVRQLGRPLRAVVNCAGICPSARVVGRKGTHALELFRRTVEVNLIGSFNVVRLAAEFMSTQEREGEENGVIVNTASIAAFDGQIGQAAYSAAKGGVAGMTLPLARDLASFGIRVVTIAPGLFETPMLAGTPGEVKVSLGAQVPHPARLGDPGEYAALVAHVIANPMLNGETIRLDGAIRMPPR